MKLHFKGKKHQLRQISNMQQAIIYESKKTRKKGNHYHPHISTSSRAAFSISDIVEMKVNIFISIQFN